jgi:hypothetical protein
VTLPSKFKQDILGILLLALAVFVFVANLSSATGFLGLLIVNTLFRSFLGVGVLVLPIFIGAYGLILLVRHEIKELTIRLTGLLILFITYVTIAQFYAPAYFTEHKVLYLKGAGGMLGYGIQFALLRLVGAWGADIIITALALIGGLMVFNVTFLNLINFFGRLFHLEPRVETEVKPKVVTQMPLIKEAPPIDKEVIPAPPVPKKPVIEFPLPSYETEGEGKPKAEAKAKAKAKDEGDPYADYK